MAYNPNRTDKSQMQGAFGGRPVPATAPPGVTGDPMGALTGGSSPMVPPAPQTSPYMNHMARFIPPQGAPRPGTTDFGSDPRMPVPGAGSGLYDPRGNPQMQAALMALLQNRGSYTPPGNMQPLAQSNMPPPPMAGAVGTQPPMGMGQLMPPPGMHPLGMQAQGQQVDPQQIAMLLQALGMRR